MLQQLKMAFLSGYYGVTTVLLGRGVRSLLIAAAELVILWYSVGQFFSTTGTERAVYLVVIQLVLYSAWTNTRIADTILTIIVFFALIATLCILLKEILP